MQSVVASGWYESEAAASSAAVAVWTKLFGAGNTRSLAAALQACSPSQAVCCSARYASWVPTQGASFCFSLHLVLQEQESLPQPPDSAGASRHDAPASAVAQLGNRPPKQPVAPQLSAFEQPQGSELGGPAGSLLSAEPRQQAAGSPQRPAYQLAPRLYSASLGEWVRNYQPVRVEGTWYWQSIKKHKVCIVAVDCSACCRLLRREVLQCQLSRPFVQAVRSEVPVCLSAYLEPCLQSGKHASRRHAELCVCRAGDLQTRGCTTQRRRHRRLPSLCGSSTGARTVCVTHLLPAQGPGQSRCAAPLSCSDSVSEPCYVADSAAGSMSVCLLSA